MDDYSNLYPLLAFFDYFGVLHIYQKASNVTDWMAFYVANHINILDISYESSFLVFQSFIF